MSRRDPMLGWSFASAMSALSALLLTSVPARASPGVACELYGINAGAPVWQGTVVLDSSYAAKIAATGARAVRIDFLLDDQPSWNETALARYDGIVDAARAAGLEPLGLFNYGALHAGQSAWNDDPDGDGMNQYVDDFASATQVVFARYTGKIQRWEIWNEPNCWSSPDYASNPQAAGCTYILPRVYAKLLAEVYIRNESLLAQNDMHLVTGGLFAHDIGGSWSPASDYMTQVYGQGVWDWMQANKGRRYVWDFFGYHLYVDQGLQTDGTKMAQYLDEIRALATQKGDSSPFYVTEVGWTTDSVSEAIEATNLTTTFGLLEKRSDVERVYWFTYQDFPGGSYGVVHDDLSAKPAESALVAAAASCTTSSGGAAGSGGVAGTGTGATGGVDAGSGGNAGSDASAGKGGSVSSGGKAGGGSGGKRSSSDDSSGCACRMGSGPDSRFFGWIVIGTLAAFIRRRHRLHLRVEDKARRCVPPLPAEHDKGERSRDGHVACK